MRIRIKIFWNNWNPDANVVTKLKDNQLNKTKNIVFLHQCYEFLNVLSKKTKGLTWSRIKNGAEWLLLAATPYTVVAMLWRLDPIATTSCGVQTRPGGHILVATSQRPRPGGLISADTSWRTHPRPGPQR